MIKEATAAAGSKESGRRKEGIVYLVYVVDVEPDRCEVAFKGSRLRAWMGRASGDALRRLLCGLARLACLLALAAAPALAGAGAPAGDFSPGDEPLRRWEPDAAA